MARCEFPRLQVLRDDGTWLRWIDGSEWCVPPGCEHAAGVCYGTDWKVVYVTNQEESDRLGVLPPPDGSEFSLADWHDAVREARDALDSAAKSEALGEGRKA